MRVGIVATDAEHQVRHAQALCEGLGRHGVQTTVYPEGTMPVEDVVACWGWRLGKPLRAAGKEVLVMERGYIDRMHWTGIGWNGLNGRARFASGAPSRFWRHFTHALRPWRPEGDYGLIVGQVSGDMSLGDLNLNDWYATAVDGVRRIGLHPVFRAHPVALEHGQQDVVDCDRINGTLAEALDRASLVVTYNSNTGVDAMLAGKPVVCCDRGSMAWPVAAHEIQIHAPVAAQRVDWAEHLAWCQWTLEEISSGYAWDCLKDFRKPH